MPDASPDHRLPALLAVSTLTVMAGATISPALPAMGRAFADAPHTDLLVRLALTLPALFTALAAPVAGRLMDRVGRRRVLLGAVALYGVGGAAGGLAPSLGLLLLSRAVLGVAVGGVLTGATTLATDYYEGDRRSAVLGAQAAAMGFGGVAFLVGGGLLADVHWRAPFAVYLAALALWPLAARWLPEPDREGPASAGADPAPSVTVPWTRVAAVYGVAFAGMVLFYTVPVQAPFYLEALGAGGGTRAGLAIAASTLTGALASMAYGRVRARLSTRALAAAVFVALGAGLAVVAGAGSYGGVVAGLGVAGVGGGLLMPHVGRWAGDLAPARARGAVVGGLTTALFVGQFLSPVLSQPVVSVSGLGGLFGVAAGVAAVLAAALAAWAVAGRRRTALSAW